MISPIDLKTLRPGDKVTIPVTYEVLAPADGCGDVKVSRVSPGAADWLLSDFTHFGTVERAPRDPEVGDRVKVRGIIGVGEVRLVDGDKLVVKYTSGILNVVPAENATFA